MLRSAARRRWRRAALAALAALAADAVTPGLSIAEPEPGSSGGEAVLSGAEIARRTNARDDGASVVRTFIMELQAPRGRVRRRVSRSFRRDFPDGRRSILFFEKPVSLEGTALLTYDYRELEQKDDQWIYLPALRKSRRIASADRGQSFLGTDFSYQDIKLETKVGVGDYVWKQVGRDQVEGHPCWLLEGTAVDELTAEELGYGRVLYRIDAALWIPRRIEYWTPDDAPLKIVEYRNVQELQGVWTPLEVEARNLQNGHVTRLVFEDLEYEAELRDSLFTQGALRRGPP